MPEAGEGVLALPDSQACQLAGVSMRRLRYWEQVGLVVPSIKRRLSEHNTVRLYSYQDLLALLVIYEVILLDPLRLRIDRPAGRSASDAGCVEKRRGVHASAPVFAGTRIRVATVQRYLQQGYQTDAILQAFPDLKVEDVDEARRQLAAAG